MNVKNKVAIVTGASSGIGLATAKLLAKHGGKVALVARSQEKSERIAMPPENDNLPPPDTTLYVAERILDGIKTQQAEIFAYDWMKELRK